MSDVANPESVRFYFSFRSPYSWLALHRVHAALEPAGVAIEYVPVFPPPDYANDPLKFPLKIAYYREDVSRIARAYGYGFAIPDPFDCNWLRPHAAWCYAAEQGRGPEFAKAMSDARFVRGENLGDDAVVGACARAVGLEAAATVAAQDTLTYQERLMNGMIRGATEDNIFGVPLFVYRGERFWGNDRIEWLLRRISEHRGLAVADLASGPMRPIYPMA